jgi:D-hexose-6-phosphate mutarotase
MTLAALNQNFSLPGHISFKEGPGGLVVAEIANALAEAVIALQGAHLLSFCPRGQAPLIWVSERAKFAPGKAIRGGVPVCWPWFGPHTADARLPAHGVARTVGWEVLSTQALADGGTFLRLGLTNTGAAGDPWPHPSSVQLDISVGTALQMTLVTRNTGTAPFVLGEALHTYFQISDVANIRIRGLEAGAYLDKVDAGARKTQQGSIAIDREVDRIYLNTSADCLIEDSALQRRIRIASQGSHATVVWNPWIDRAAKMDDFAAQGYRDMVCVETANAADNVVIVQPGAVHRMTATYSVEALG